jgi:hypothetical protein
MRAEESGGIRHIGGKTFIRTRILKTLREAYLSRAHAKSHGHLARIIPRKEDGKTYYDLYLR